MESTETAVQHEEDAEMVSLREYPEVQDAHEHALVLLAMGAECGVMETSNGQFSLEVPVRQQPRACREIELYENERLELEANRGGWAGGVEVVHPIGWAWHFSWVVLTVMMLWWSQIEPSLLDRVGQSHQTVWQRGEWWRGFTALWVHADVGHWAGNALSGTVFAALCARELGAGRAWAGILVAGSLGNLVSSGLAAEPTTMTVGASTAVFAALGMVAVLAWGRQPSGVNEITLRQRLRRAAPMLGGLVMLGWLGTGAGIQDRVTDVRAHLAGFASGLLLGLWLRWIRSCDRQAA